MRPRQWLTQRRTQQNLLVWRMWRAMRVARAGDDMTDSAPAGGIDTEFLHACPAVLKGIQKFRILWRPLTVLASSSPPKRIIPTRPQTRPGPDVHAIERPTARGEVDRCPRSLGESPREVDRGAAGRVGVGTDRCAQPSAAMLIGGEAVMDRDGEQHGTIIRLAGLDALTGTAPRPPVRRHGPVSIGGSRR